MKKNKIILWVMAICLITGLIVTPCVYTKAETISVPYRYNGKNYTYKGSRKNATVNGKNLSLSTVPVLYLSGYNMGPYYELFVSSGLKAKRTYSTKTKVLTLTYGSKTLKMTLNKRTAYLNGKKITLPVAPKYIVYRKSGKGRILVPIKSVCSYLGLTYQWVSSGSRFFISKPSSSNNMSGTGTAQENILPGYTIKLKRPSTINKGTVTATDDYHNRRLVLTMPGDLRQFYSENKPEISNSVKFTMSYSASANQTKLYFKTTTINGFVVKEGESDIYIKNAKPTSIYKHVIVLDPGHGGSDSGAVGNGYKEKNFTLSIVKAAKKYFDANSAYKVYYTRLSDAYPSLKARYDFANEVEADVFVSVHINSAGATATGTETLYNPDRNKVKNGLSCYQLAKTMQTYVRNSTGFSNRGIKERCTRLKNGLAVLNHNNGPATLTEIGFISNPTEAKKMAANLSIYGKAVYQAVVEATK